MSPSQTSPSANQTDREMNAKERGDHQGLGAVGIRTPPLPNVPPLDPDHRNHRSGMPVSYTHLTLPTSDLV